MLDGVKAGQHHANYSPWNFYSCVGRYNCFFTKNLQNPDTILEQPAWLYHRYLAAFNDDCFGDEKQAIDIAYFDFSKTVKTMFGCIFVTMFERYGQDGFDETMIDETMIGPSGSENSG